MLGRGIMARSHGAPKLMVNRPKMVKSEWTREDDELAEDIQALPQELQDMILWETDAFHIPATVSITDCWPKYGYDNEDEPIEPYYIPPLALQINRSLRAQFAKAYYGTVTFEYVVDHYPYVYPDDDKLESWLNGLSDAHRIMIHCVQITDVCQVKKVSKSHKKTCVKLAKRLRSRLVQLGLKQGDRLELVLASAFEWGQRVERYNARGELILQ